MNLFRFISTKLNNQAHRYRTYSDGVKMGRTIKKFKACGSGVFIQQPVRLEGEHGISLGNNVSINAFVHMWGHGTITIGNDCLIASHVSITSLTHDTGVHPYRDRIVQREVHIGNNVWIGSHSVILPGVKIGDNAIVGAGAVVTKDVPANVTVAGVPARIIKRHG